MSAGRLILAGNAAGPVLSAAEGLSFWGGVDPATARVIATTLGVTLFATSAQPVSAAFAGALATGVGTTTGVGVINEVAPRVSALPARPAASPTSASFPHPCRRAGGSG